MRARMSSPHPPTSSAGLAGRVVVITGAARGIGAGSAQAMAARGARVALVGLEADELARVAATCGSQATWHEADITDRGAIGAAVDAVLARHGRIDALVANA